MIKTTYICDRCNSEYEPFDPNDSRFVFEIKQYWDPDNHDKMDLCPNCHQELVNWFTCKNSIINSAAYATELIQQLSEKGVFGISGHLQGNYKDENHFMEYHVTEKVFIEIATSKNIIDKIVTFDRNTDKKDYRYEHYLSFGNYKIFFINGKSNLFEPAL